MKVATKPHHLAARYSKGDLHVHKLEAVAKAAANFLRCRKNSLRAEKDKHAMECFHQGSITDLQRIADDARNLIDVH